MTTTQHLTATYASDWAWTIVRSPNLRFQARAALVLLTFARLADEALDSPKGYTETTVSEVYNALDVAGFEIVLRDVQDLVRAGLLVRTESHNYRISEEAFQS